VLTQDANNKKLYHGSRIDLGKDTSVEDARQSLYEETGKHGLRFHQSDEAKEAFILSTSVLILRATQAEKIFSKILTHHSPKTPIESVITQGGHMAMRVTQDVSDATRDAWRFFVDKKKNGRDEESPLLRKEVFVSRELYSLLTKTEHEDALVQLSTFPEALRKHEVNSGVIIEIWKKKAQEALHISPEESEDLLEDVIDTWHLMKNANTIVSFAADTRVGTGAALYALSVMSMEGVVSDDFDQGMEVEAPFSTEAISLSTQEQEVVFSLFIPMGEASSEQKKEVEKKILPITVDQQTLMRTVKFVQKIDVLPPSEQKRMIVEEKKQTIIQILFLWEVVGEAARSKAKSKTQSISSDRQSLSTFKEHHKENAPVEEFTFALAAWMLLKLTQYYVSLEGLETFVDKREEVSLLASIQKEKPKGLVQKETGQWILLSIIWYLAQIREQGLVQQKATPKKKKKKHAPIVIFAYGS
jgi:hypothetical protein